MRRIVVAEDAKGTSRIVSDSQVAGKSIPGIGLLTRVWSADSAASYPDAGEDPQAEGLYPPVGGVRLVVSRYAPGQKVTGDCNDSLGIAWSDDGMHRTDTTDFVLVISGALTLTVDGGTETVLRAGEVGVMAGANHAWRNDSPEETVVAFVMVGARREEKA